MLARSQESGKEEGDLVGQRAKHKKHLLFSAPEKIEKTKNKNKTKQTTP